MPNWQVVTSEYTRLLQARAVFDSAVVEVIGARNEGGCAALELLAAEVEQLKRNLLAALRPARSGAPPGTGLAC